MVNLEQILEFLETSEHTFNCFFIDDEGLDHPIDQYQVAFLVAQNKYTVKIEDLETVVENTDGFTLHCFIAPAGAKSFGVHEDTCDVTIYCVEGIKTMNINGKEILISEGEQVFIPQGTPHEATNIYKSVILSIGS